MSDARYTRIGVLWECNDCETDGRGYWEWFAHDLFHHSRLGRAIRWVNA